MTKQTNKVFVVAADGVQLAGVPASGAEVDAALAKEWIANGLAVAKAPATPAADKDK